MTEETEGTVPPSRPNNVISLVHRRSAEADADAEAILNDPLLNSLDLLNDFLDEVIDSMVQDTVSPITGVCIVMTHSDGGVSHAHTSEVNSLAALIGGLEMKKVRMVLSTDSQ